MSGVSFKVFNSVGDCFADMTDTFKEIGEMLLTSHDMRFAKNQAPDGRSWLPDKPATIDAYSRFKTKSMRFGAKASNRFNTKSRAFEKKLEQIKTAASSSKRILIWNNVMLRTISYRANKDNLWLGTSVLSKDYAATQQFGDPNRGIPARPFLGLSEQDKQAATDIILKSIKQKIANAGK